VTDIAPPIAHSWDIDAITAEVLAVLRREPGTPDADDARVRSAVERACARLDKYLDALADVLPMDQPELVEAAVELAVEVYRSKDAPFGVLDAWSADAVPVRISSDRLRNVRSLAVAHKSRFGLG
jgi:hypothetical protein